MTKTDRDMDMLDDLFDGAASDPALAPSPDFMARVLADAETHQEVMRAASVSPDPTRRSKGKLFRLMQSLGGWPTLAGLATATIAGVWVGFSATFTVLPDALTDVLGSTDDYYLTYLDSGYVFGDEEG
nr:hypothetical protein [uncultured Shimia sp.]